MKNKIENPPEHQVHNPRSPGYIFLDKALNIASFLIGTTTTVSGSSYSDNFRPPYEVKVRW